MKINKNIIITGPTATGKTHLAVALANHFNGEIISADSRQVYKGLDIGTGKDLDEYSSESFCIPYHLIDVVHPNDEYNLLRFRQDAPRIIEEIHTRGHLPIISGGTPLYIDSIISDYDMQGGPPDEKLRNALNQLSNDELLIILSKEFPKAYEQLKMGHNRKRMIRTIERIRSERNAKIPEIDNNEYLIIGVYLHRKEVHKRIEQRLNDRFKKENMLDEVKKLHSNGISWERLEYFGLEYKYMALHLQGELTLDEMHDKLLIKIRQFAKRQDIWFRKMEREGHIIHWIKKGDFNQASTLINLFLNNKSLPDPKIKISEIKYN